MQLSSEQKVIIDKTEEKVCPDCEGEGVLYGMYTRRGRNVMYAEECMKCEGKQVRPRSYPNLKVRR